MIMTNAKASATELPHVGTLDNVNTESLHSMEKTTNFQLGTPCILKSEQITSTPTIHRVSKVYKISKLGSTKRGGLSNCYVCNKLYSRSSYRRHLRIHTGEKPYVCDLCPKTFVDRTSLRHHRRVHTGEKPFRCPHCCYRSSQSQHLTKHLGSKHSNK